jgi:hypothetical protein
MGVGQCASIARPDVLDRNPGVDGAHIRRNPGLDGAHIRRNPGLNGTHICRRRGAQELGVEADFEPPEAGVC